jgi:hypothetical protein
MPTSSRTAIREKAGFVERDRAVNLNLEGLPVFLELPAMQRAIRQPNAEA